VCFVGLPECFWIDFKISAWCAFSMRPEFYYFSEII
jgi:hypothetical protein